jgi:hypothetical protein
VLEPTGEATLQRLNGENEFLSGGGTFEQVYSNDPHGQGQHDGGERQQFVSSGPGFQTARADFEAIEQRRKFGFDFGKHG